MVNFGGEDVVKKYGGDGREQANRGCEQTFSDSGSDDREAGIFTHRDTLKGIHNAPNRSK